MPARFLSRLYVLSFAVAACAIALLVAASRAGTMNGRQSVLPNGWAIWSPNDLSVQTGTMPQGAALSADGKVLAVVESGYNPAALALYETPTLRQVKRITLPGAFGRPRWNGNHILVAGANADAVFDVDSITWAARKIALPAKSYPVAIALAGNRLAVATDGDGSVRIGTVAGIASARPIHIGDHPAEMSFSNDGTKLFVPVRSANYVVSVDATSLAQRRIPAGLHPTDTLVAGDELYVAQSDDDTVGIYNARSGTRVTNVFVGNGSEQAGTTGASPNALASSGSDVFVSLGAANQIAVIRNHEVVAHVAAGWYPTDVVPALGRLYVLNGKGEGTRPNPFFDPKGKSDRDYVAAIQFGSIRAVPFPDKAATQQNPQGSIGWSDPPGNSIVHKDGPIKHVFFILKENRSYDQVLGDMPQGNGDRALVWFGKRVTPNQHAVAAQFGLFDNAYASGEVSASGHNWADAAFANDYVERYWPSIYGNRNNAGDLNDGVGAAVPHQGYLWDAARRAHVSFRDYGEITSSPSGIPSGPLTKLLANRFDPHYVSWNLDYSDLDRVKEWRREFDAFIRNGNLPQFEYIWLPNDHTYGSRAGKLTPVALVAQNDYAVGQMVQTISHSPVWRSSAIFITEDDAQDGPDHVSAQRTTLYVISPYAARGVHHEHYSTLSIDRTIEILLGMEPLSTYDAKAVPLYAAFSATASQKPFDAIPPQVDIHARNSKVAYGAHLSARLDFNRPDAASAGTLMKILARNHNR